MTPSAILLTICIFLFVALSGSFVAYFIMKTYRRRAVVAMRVSKRAEVRKKKLSIQPAAQEGIQPQYHLTKAK